MGVSPIGSLRRWPCVGDPNKGPMFSCGAEGTVSLLALVAAGRVGESHDPDAPMVVHATVCPGHVRPLRAWLLERGGGQGGVDVYGTEMLMDRWEQVTETLGVPVWQYTRKTA